jgi:hypothetical protein
VRIDLPSGGWAELRDPADITERLRRPVQRTTMRVSQEGWLSLLASDKVTKFAEGPVDGKSPPPKPTEEEIALAKTPLSEADVDAFSDLNDYVVVALTESWSFPEPISLDGLLDRKKDDYDKLRAETAPHVLTMFPNFSPTKDEASPTPPSSESVTSLREEMVTTSPTSSGSGGS